MSNGSRLNVLTPCSAAEPAATTELPESVVEAQRRAALDVFLDDAAMGFHWDILDRLQEGVYITDLQRRVRYWSKGAERLSGYSSTEALGRKCADALLRHVDEKGNCLCTLGCPLAAVIADGQARSADLYLHHKNGHRIPVHVNAMPIRNLDGRIIGAFETFSDNTETMAALERLRHMEGAVYIDSLTGVPNRRGLDCGLADYFARLKRGERSFSLLICDVDYFKNINDVHGHEAGDAVLKMVANTLKHACRTSDLVARWGGEEFVVLTEQVRPERVCAVADRLRMMVEHSWATHDGAQIQVTISLGATVARPDDSQHTLFERADRLLYTSKQQGRNRYTFGE